MHVEGGGGGCQTNNCLGCKPLGIICIGCTCGKEDMQRNLVSEPASDLDSIIYVHEGIEAHIILYVSVTWRHLAHAHLVRVRV